MRGGQRQALHLATGLQQLQHEVLAVVRHRSWLQDALQQQGINSAALSARSDIDLASAWRLRRILKDFRPNVIHANEARAHALCAWVRFLGVPAPLVVSRRSLEPPHRRSRIKYHAADRYLAVSHAVSQVLQESQVVNARAIRVVMPGVAVGGQTSPARAGTCRIAATIGAYTHEKGIDLAVAAGALLSRTDVEWRVYGAGPLEGRLREQIKNTGSTVRLMGPTADPLAALAESDIVVIPSRAEALGNTALEALSIGKPVVATEVGGIPEIIDSTVGTLVAPDDPAALAAAVAAWLGDPQRAVAVGERCRAVARHHSVERMVRATVEVYEELGGETDN